MLNKNTSELLEELKSCESFKKFKNENTSQIVKSNLSECLNSLLESKKMKKSDIIKASSVNDVYAYQIFSGVRIPERKKVLSILIAMKATLDEVQSLLKSTGYTPLYVKNPFDCVIIYGICNNLSVININEVLYENNLELLE